MTELSAAELDTLIGLVEFGPLWDGDIPSKAGRDSLIKMGFAVRIILCGEDGYTAATYSGGNAYTERYGPADTIGQAMGNRLVLKHLSKK